jgi:hypothetical protein
MTIDTVHLSTANLYTESFYAKYDNNGNLLWAKSTNGDYTNLITGLAFDHQNSIFLTGFFGSSFRMDTSTIQSQSPSYDIVLAKIDESGNLEWIRRAGGGYDDAGRAVCSDASGNAIITGFFMETAYFGNDSVVYDNYDDVFVAKYDGAGNNLWVKAGKGPQIDIGFAIATNSNGDVFATGVFQDSINFDGTILSCPSRQAFVACYKADGTFRWASQGGGTQTASGLGIAVASTGAVILSGYYQFNCTFGTISLDVAQSSAYDIFIASCMATQGDAIISMNNSPVSVYPNPIAANSRIVISSDFVEAGFVIRNGIGQIVNQGSLISKRYEIPDLSAGIYFISLSDGNKTGTAKFIVE